MKTFARALLAFSLLAGAVALSGCSDTLAKMERVYETVTSSKVSSKTIVLAIQTFDTAKIGATGWLNLRRCDGTNGPICRDPALMTRVRDAMAEGTDARDKLKAWLRVNPDGLGPQDLYNKLEAATAAIQTITAIYTAATR